jgi:hypothetical protein
MISQETAVDIYNAYRDIEAGKKLLADMEEAAKFPHELNKTEPRIKDAFGRRQHLQLGIPCGDNGHRLLDVSPKLAESIIRAHIANKEAELKEIQEVARIELLA